jgi:hypothetical protein
MRNACGGVMQHVPFQGPSSDGKVSAWYAEASQLIRLEGYTVTAAVEFVVLRYLELGHLDPLFDAALRGHVHTIMVMKYVAALLEPRQLKNNFSGRIRYVGIKPRLKVGRPKLGGISFLEKHVLDVLNEGIEALAKAIDPGLMFWFYLCAAINPDTIEPNYRRVVEQDLQAIFPPKVKKLLHALAPDQRP